MMGEWRQTRKPMWAVITVFSLVVVVNAAQRMGLGVLTSASMALAALALLFGGAVIVALALVWVWSFIDPDIDDGGGAPATELSWWQQLLGVATVPVSAMTLPALVAVLRLLPDAGVRLVLPGNAHEEFREEYT